MFFRRRAHRLPKFPPQIATLFKSLCIDASYEQFEELREQFDDAWLTKVAEMKENIGFDTMLAEKLKGACRTLIDSYESLPSDAQRKLAIGAIRYCLVDDDGLPDEIFASGQRDDAKVVNHVLEELGYLDSIIDL